jgi:hypothetical protein
MEPPELDGAGEKEILVEMTLKCCRMITSGVWGLALSLKLCTD